MHTKLCAHKADECLEAGIGGQEYDSDLPLHTQLTHFQTVTEPLRENATTILLTVLVFPPILKSHLLQKQASHFALQKERVSKGTSCRIAVMVAVTTFSIS